VDLFYYVKKRDISVCVWNFEEYLLAITYYIICTLYHMQGIKWETNPALPNFNPPPLLSDKFTI